MSDPIKQPKHYTRFEDGVEPIQLAEQLPFNLGNVVKYVSRAGFKDGTDALTDIGKAEQYLKLEKARIKRRLQKTRVRVKRSDRNP